MPNIIPQGTGVSAWVDVVVAQGMSKTLFITSGTANTTAKDTEYEVAFKVGASDYAPFDTVDPGNIKQKGVIRAPGTWGVRRIRGTSGLSAEG